MKRKEIFRAQNARLDCQGKSACVLTFNLLEGELLGVHTPRTQQGLSVISELVMRKITVSSGGLFYYETEYGGPAPARGWPNISCIRSQSSLVEEMSVLDNLFLLRKRKNRSLLYSNWRLRIELTRQMENFGLHFSPEQPVSTLSQMEKYVLEVFKAYLHGADIIILDQVSWEPVTAGIFRQLYDLIAYLKEEGVSFIIVSDKLNNLKACADRIAFFDGEQIVTILYNTPENSRRISETYDALVRSFAQGKYRNEQLQGQREPIELRDPLLTSLTLVRGEKVAIFDPEAKLYHELLLNRRNYRVPLAGGVVITNQSKQRKQEEKPRVIFADFSRYDTIFDSLPVMDNLFLGRNNGLNMLRILRNKYRDMIKREFAERYSDCEMLEYGEGSQLSLEQRFKLYLFRLSITNPDVVIAWKCPKADPMMVALMEDAADALTANNKTMCYLSMDVFEPVGKVDRYILVTDTGIESYLSYEKLLERQSHQAYESDRI